MAARSWAACWIAPEAEGSRSAKLLPDLLKMRGPCLRPRGRITPYLRIWDSRNQDPLGLPIMTHNAPERRRRSSGLISLSGGVGRIWIGTTASGRADRLERSRRTVHCLWHDVTVRTRPESLPVVPLRRAPGGDGTVVPAESGLSPVTSGAPSFGALSASACLLAGASVEPTAIFRFDRLVGSLGSSVLRALRAHPA